MKNKEQILHTDNLTVFQDKKLNMRLVNLNIPLYQTNFITDAQSILSKSVYRTIKLIIKKIQDSRIDIASYIQNEEVLRLYISRKEIVQWYPDNNASRELYTATEWLNNTSVKYQTPTEWVNAKLIGEANFSEERGLNIYITPSVLPLYNVVGSNFTLLDFAVAMNIQNKAATFFYDKCCKWRSFGIFSFTPDELQEALHVSTNSTRMRTRYVLPADEEIKKLFLKGTIDFYFDSYEIRSGKGRGGKVDKFVFRIHDCLPGSKKDETQKLYMRSFIMNSIKELVPNIMSNNILLQLKELSREELKDLYNDISYLKQEIHTGKIKDLKGVIWMNLRNKYNININGETRLKKNANNSYPKYIRIGEELRINNLGESNVTKEIDASEAIDVYEEDSKQVWWQNWLNTIMFVENGLGRGGSTLSNSEKEMIRSLFNAQGNIVPSFDGSVLTIHFQADIFRNYVYKPVLPFLKGLKDVLRDGAYTHFPGLQILHYTYTDSAGNEKIMNMTK